MQCQKCQSANPENARYCNQCGAVLDSTPPPPAPPQAIDEKIAKIQRYLPQGLAERILNQRDRIEGERKHVTVMFCDMEGFMPLVERLGPEAAYTIMDEVYEILIQQVNDFEGTVNEMTGDGIMALFGAPIALEEAPQRALWAAHAIHREIAAFNAKQKGLGPIRMRIGVHTGPVVVGALGSDLRVEFKAVGDTVNLASRMEQLATPGTTCVTREVYQLAQGMFTFENLGPKLIKGRAKSIPVYRMRSGRKAVYRPRPGSERMIFSAMVGREQQLLQLDEQVRKVLAGTGGVINIVGEAGIGKSRLLAELKQREDIQQVTLLEGHAVSMGRNLSFHPMIDLLKQLARIEVDHHADKAFSRLETALQTLLGDQADEVIPFVATLMGMDLPAPYDARLEGVEGEALEKLIRKNMRTLLCRLSAQRPLVMVIDNLHWADKSTVELLLSLFRLAADARILFINIYRPGYAATGQGIKAFNQSAPPVPQVDIILEPLDTRCSEKLIANMLNLQGRAHHALIEQIVKRASGNPYFIEEVVRSFIDEGAVVVRGGKFEVTSRLSQLTIPDTIRDVLMARIDRLEEDARNLLKVAAVIGRSFFYRILAAVADSVHNLDQQLTYLKKTELIRERRRLEELEYLFKHALAQEAAYASILPEKRKALHLKVADTIQTVFAEKLHVFYGMLAYHYSRADNLDKAEEVLIKAGEEAAKTSASIEALYYYREALLLYQRNAGDAADSEKVALLEKNIALALYNRGQYEEALAYFDRALSWYGNRPAAHSFAAAIILISGLSHLLACFYLRAFKFRKHPSRKDLDALDLYFKKLKALGIIQPKRFFIESMHFYRSISRFDLAQIELGYGFFVGASSLFSFSGLSFWLSRKVIESVRERIDRRDSKSYIIFDFTETLHCYLVGRWHRIQPVDDHLIEQNLKIGEVYWSSLDLHWHCLPMLYQGDLEAARRIIARLADIADTYENDFAMLLKLLLNTGLLLISRQLPEAMEETEEGILFARKNNFSLGLIHFYGCKAQIHLLKDEIEAATLALEKAEKSRSEMETVPWQISMLLKGQAALALHLLKQTTRNGTKKVGLKYREKAAQACTALLKQSRCVAQHRTEACRMMGDYHWLIQKPKKAFKWWRRSVTVGRRLGARLELARSYFEIGQRLLDPKSPYTTMEGTEASGLLRKAREEFESMGLQWDLDTVSRLDIQ